MKRWDIDDVVRLTGDIYEVANNQQDWPTVLARICGILDGSRACVQRFDDCGIPHESESNVPEGRSFIEELTNGGWSPLTPLTKTLLILPPGSTYREYAYVDAARWRRSSIWNELMAPRDMYGGIGCRLGGTPGADDWWILDVQRGRNQPEFDHAEMEFIGLLSPSLCRAMAMGFGIPGDTVEKRVFDSLSSELIVVSSDMKVVRMNRAAETVMERHGLCISRGTLMTGNAGTTRRLQNLVANACSLVNGVPGVSGDLLLRRPECPTGGVVISVVPLFSGKRSGRDANPCAAVYLRETLPAPSEGFARRASAIFGLSMREGEVAARMVEGKSLREIAEEDGVSVTTVRTHLGNLFRKTDTNRQSQLVAMLSRISDVGRLS